MIQRRHIQYIIFIISDVMLSLYTPKDSALGIGWKHFMYKTSKKKLTDHCIAMCIYIVSEQIKSRGVVCTVFKLRMHQFDGVTLLHKCTNHMLGGPFHGFIIMYNAVQY